ncbi:uncharacterized protein LOC131882589 [Tigriopus californicus]|nr:uncharacterized protein LOC131882589 [Tigriopus californicus]
MRKKYQRFFKKLQEPAAPRPPGSPAAPRPRARGRAQPVDNAQPSVATFFRVPSDSDEELALAPAAPAPADSDDGWPTIDELMKTSDDDKPEDPAHVQRLLAQARENIQRYEEREQEREKAREEKERAESLAQTRQAVIDKENIAFRERLDVELDEDRTRQAIRGNFQYLQDVWDGKVESKRYQIFKKGGPPAHALMFQMITDPFSDRHLDWIMAEIQKKWMPNERLHAIHNDFVWKVILAEALIKIYADMFDLSKEEAELRINQTPLRPEHGGSNFIT